MQGSFGSKNATTGWLADHTFRFGSICQSRHAAFMCTVSALRTISKVQFRMEVTDRLVAELLNGVITIVHVTYVEQRMVVNSGLG
jgi:hypothetical protein